MLSQAKMAKVSEGNKFFNLHLSLHIYWKLIPSMKYLFYFGKLLGGPESNLTRPLVSRSLQHVIRVFLYFGR